MRCRATRLVLALALVGCGAAGGPPAPELPATPPEQVAAFLAERSEPERRDAPLLGAGDVVRIDAVGVDEVTGTYQVSRRGEIRVPFVGEVRAGGRTVDELLDELARRLRVVVNEPLVDVRLVERASAEATVAGAVVSPGRVAIGTRGRTLGEALALAGGLREDASGVVRVVPAAKAPRGLFAEPVPDEERAIELPADDAAALGLELRHGDRVHAVSRGGDAPDPAAESLPRLVPAVEATPLAETAGSDAADANVTGERPVEPRAETGARAGPAGDDAAPSVRSALGAGEEPPVETPPAALAELEPAPREPTADPVPPAEPAAPLAEDDLTAGVEQHLAAAGRELEDRVALEHEVRESRDRVRALEEAVRAERAEAESLRTRLAELEARLDARDRALRGAYGEAFPIADASPPAPAPADAGPPPGTPSPALEPEGAPAADSAATLEPAAPTDAAVAEETPLGDDEAEQSRGIFGGLLGVFGGDAAADAPEVAEEAEPAPEIAALAEEASESRVEIVGRVAKPGPYGLGSARTVSRAIEIAGASADANLGAIVVRRPWGATVWSILVNLEDVRAGRASDLLLVDGDVVVVPVLE